MFVGEAFTSLWSWLFHVDCLLSAPRLRPNYLLKGSIDRRAQHDGQLGHNEMAGSDEQVMLQFALTGIHLERLVVVGGDLAYLIDLPRDRLLTHTEVRLCAGTCGGYW